MRRIDNPRLIAFTLPFYIPNEAEYLSLLLHSGTFDRVHIRKPDSSSDAMRKLLEEIPENLYSRLTLHDFHELAQEYGCGINLNSRHPIKPKDFHGIVSRSCHSLEETRRFKEEDYLFLSPIFPSISKPGYTSNFNLSELKGVIDKRTIALGGVTPDRLQEIFSFGFGGAAMLGAIWEEVRKGNLTKLIIKLKDINASIHNS